MRSIIIICTCTCIWTCVFACAFAWARACMHARVRSITDHAYARLNLKSSSRHAGNSNRENTVCRLSLTVRHLIQVICVGESYGKNLAWIWHTVASLRTSVYLLELHNVLKLFEETGEVSPKLRSKRDDTRKIDNSGELYILGLLLENPSLHLGEMCQKIHSTFGMLVTPSTVCRIIKRNGFTRKKIQQVAKQRSVEFRGRFFAEVQHYHPNQFVWVDESGCDRRDHIRNFGYALRGDSCDSCIEVREYLLSLHFPPME